MGLVRFVWAGVDRKEFGLIRLVRIGLGYVGFTGLARVGLECTG